MGEPYQKPIPVAQTVPRKVQSTVMAARKRGKPWLKLWGEVVRASKVANLTDSQFRWWINLLAIATEYDGEGSGLLPDFNSIGFNLHKTDAEVESAIHDLVGRRLVDVDGEGSYRMHDYTNWQSGDVGPSLPVKAKRKAPAKKAEVAPGEEKELTPIQAVVAGYCDAVDIDPRELGPNYGRYSRAFQGVAAAGYTREDARRLTRFVATSDYWKGGRATPPPENVVAQIGAWKASGKPDAWRPGMRQVTSGRVSVAGAITHMGERH